MAGAAGAMRILAFDTALGACSVALVEHGAVLAGEQRLQRQGQAESLLPLIERVLGAAGRSYGELDLIAVTVGPGTFTGLRIGLAAARGLSLASGVPLAGVTTLEALAEGVPADARAGRTVLSAIDARRGEVYAQAFAAAPLGPPQLLDRAAAARLAPPGPVALVGSGSPLLAALLGERDLIAAGGPDNPAPAAIAALAARRGLPSRDASPPVPLYLRAPDA
ncbi:MAG TPA: tRNA (adenosine(37)-N6)-threonylcarbamoyltransferase complex dimerization subunit type 1 TsaB, partial [Candidatus Sulfotelmatobacter sp.]|nr:tRNA (adenosine(37)-N6)-threonylcarbamoyltransferase complex dimerization subunit type 1 TsaB [Candidatus Sulfotelmatobacter sp.]